MHLTRSKCVNFLSFGSLLFIHLVFASKDTVLVSNKKDDHSNIPDKPLPTDNGDSEKGSQLKSKVFSDAKSFDKLFIEGQKAYHDQLWYSCAYKLEQSIKLYKVYKDIVTECRIQCLWGDRSSRFSNFSMSVGDFTQLTHVLKTADCMRRCREEQLGDQKQVTSDYDSIFEERKPYHYLQFCYYKLEKFQQAAAATYTHYLANPEDADTKTNMDYYKVTLRMPASDFIDLEMTPYREHYIRGGLAYVDKNWPVVVSNMENCLKEYFQEDERCRANCFDTGRIKGVEFLTGVADLVIKVMICQMSCEDKLSKLYTEPEPHFLDSVFHYLQYAHYQMEDLENSAEATASFLLLNPDHTVMKENRDVIQDLLKITYDDFVPREAVQQYVKRKKEMYSDMDFINKNYKWGDISEEEGNLGEEILTEETEIPDNWMTRYERLGMHVMAKSSDLHREQRFITDGLLKQDMCDELIKLMDGVPKQASGAQVFDLKLAKRTMTDKLDENYEASLRTLIRSAEVIRHYTQRYNDLDGGYYLKKTLLVCWGPGEDPNEKLDCHPQEDGSCLLYKDMSEDYYNDLFTTVTYLTPNGGFTFLGDDEEEDYSSQLKCGRTMGFNTGDRHKLNVPKEEDAKRCAMVIKHSTDKSDDEKEYQEAIALLHRLDELRLEMNMKTAKEVMKSFEDKGVKVVQTGEDLQGKERFVADGMASSEECSHLRDMVMNFGIFGDGYAGQKSPHTENEKFFGLSVDQLTQSDAIFGDGYDHLFKKPSLISPHTEHELFRGITIYRAAKMMHAGMIPVPAVKAFLELSESSRLFVERYFNLTKPLYFDFTHLVCRSAVDDSNENREDLSHPVHSDNCILQPDGSCTKGFPAFTQRDYSAVLYLNDDFKGGEFFFANSDKTEQVSLSPKCGRLVGFNAGEFHGVRAVTSGNRCAMALWFTHNVNFKELGHVQARKVLQDTEKAIAKTHKAPLHDDL